MKKETALLIITIIIPLVLTACNSQPQEISVDFLDDIMKTYRENGMETLADILAVYNADENPIDYKGYKETLERYVTDSSVDYVSMASYVMIAAISEKIGADIGYFEEYEGYVSKLKKLTGETDATAGIVDYIFAYYALKTGNIEFDGSKVIDYLRREQYDSVDKTAFAIPLLCYIKSRNIADVTDTLDKAEAFLESKINGNGVIAYDGEEHAAATAMAFSAMITYYNGIENPFTTRSFNALGRFKKTKSNGFSAVLNGEPDRDATAWCAVALGDMIKGRSVFMLLME